jgi:hypothetical protein
MCRCRNGNESIVDFVVALLSDYIISKLFIYPYVKHYIMGFAYCINFKLK